MTDHEKSPAQGGEMPPVERAAITGSGGISTVRGAKPPSNAAQERNTNEAALDRDIAHLIDCSEGGIARVPRETLVRLRALLTSPRAVLPRHVFASLECTAVWLEKGNDPQDAARELHACLAKIDAAPAAPVAEPSPAENAELASMTRMFHAACADLGLINEALGLNPDDGGAEPILDAIQKLKDERDQWVDANYSTPSDNVVGAFRMLLAACNRLWAEAEEIEGPDGLAQVALQQYWDAFIDARDKAQSAILSLPGSGCNPVDPCAGCRCQYSSVAAQAVAADGAPTGIDTKAIAESLERMIVDWYADCERTRLDWKQMAGVIKLRLDRFLKRAAVSPATADERAAPMSSDIRAYLENLAKAGSEPLNSAVAYKDKASRMHFMVEVRNGARALLARASQAVAREHDDPEIIAASNRGYAAGLRDGKALSACGPLTADAGKPFQSRVQPWLLECFGPTIAADRVERNHRFLEEALETVQSLGCTASEAHQLVDYTFGRPIGEPVQEVGGVMVTLAALCLASALDMHQAGETELARISEPATVLKIRAKQAAKPKHSPLPQAVAARAPYEWRDTGPLETDEGGAA
ncbi:hypothetical protein [Burkholderia gladioli]|uniref:hypothetical protein n=1 Tax=Burkholderia gladioli TaxID=28095 RepID=UPI001ABA7FC9|nr:hypothetical protein [Burkholderia gladioli]